MADSTSIPIIVQGNSFSLAIPLQIYYINGDQMDLEDYTPDPTDEVSVQLKGSRRNYTYTPTIDGNVANIDLTGNELADNYGVVVSIVKANGQRLRSFRTDQFFIVESSDDLTVDDIIEGLEENVIYLNTQCFVAGADGRGITSIVKTSTAGLVDTYTITYSDNTTSTFDVTNGAQGEAGATIESVEKTATVGKVDTYTITMTDGNTFNFQVTNGLDGVDLGLANIVNDLTTGGATNVLSAEAGKLIKENVQMLLDALGNYAFPNGKPSLNWNLSLVSVALELTNVSSSNTDETAEIGEAYTTTLTCSNISNLYVADVVVKMDGVDITSTAYTPSTGVVSIAEVTGNIEITATQITYIASGLVLHLDGKNRGGTSGTWKDLAGSNDFTLNDVTETTDGVTFKGLSTSYGDGSAVDVGCDAGTIEVVIDALSLANGAAVLANPRLKGIAFVGWDYNGSVGYVMQTIRSASDEYNGAMFLPTNKGAGAFSINKDAALIDGVQVTPTNSAISWSSTQITSGHSRLGWLRSDKLFNGTIKSIRVYNRKLTAAEMLANYKIDKKRFNLT